MMIRGKLAGRIACVFILTLLMVWSYPPGVASADDGLERQETIEVTYLEYTWRLFRLEDNTRICEVRVDHQGEPTQSEIYFQCGRSIYYQWFDSKECEEFSGRNSEDCGGLYFYLARIDEVTKEIVLDLPTPTARIDLVGCNPIEATDLCASLPILVITVEEPLPNEEIIQIQGRINDDSFLCSGSVCEVGLDETNNSGVPIEFWADSSYGDSTENYAGQIRIARRTIADPSTTGWQVEILSGFGGLENMKGCAGIWDSFPPLGPEPEWLQNPTETTMLKTTEPYAFLAGQIIQEGFVDTSHCDDQGILPNGYASQCGLESSRFLVTLWQNAFDRHIIETAAETGIPASLLKRMFAHESQFWPETTHDLYREYGLGHITELGADATLLWNREFYDQFCPTVLEIGKCQLGYGILDDWSQAILRWALLAEMEIIIPDSAYAMDYDQVEESISLFAEVLLGNCAQVGQMISYETDEIPGEIVSYEDLWRLTLANFHGGSGCVAGALIDVHKNKAELNWGNISASLSENCPLPVEYVEDVTTE
jgi:hypothetical protein